MSSLERAVRTVRRSFPDGGSVDDPSELGDPNDPSAVGASRFMTEPIGQHPPLQIGVGPGFPGYQTPVAGAGPLSKATDVAKSFLPVPEGAEQRINRKINRDPDVGAPKNQGATQLEPGIYVGNVTPEQWMERTDKFLPPQELAKARTWYRDALGTYENYFGKERGAQMLGAWLVANKNATPGFAQLSATRALEQYQNRSAEFGTQKQAGLAHDQLSNYWDSILSGNPQNLGKMGGQKIYDFVDSALGRPTRTFYGDDPRAGSPAVADVHSLRDMGFIDEPVVKWVQQKYGDKAAKNLIADSYQGSPSEPQYEWASDKMRGLTEHLNKIGYQGGNWTPTELQAVGWTSMSKMLGRKAQTAEEAVQSNIRNLSYELDFGAGAPYNKQFPEWAALSPQQKSNVTNAILPSITDFAAKETGAHVWQQQAGLGGWHEFTNPSYKTRLIASPEVANDVANMVGYLAQQSKVFGYKWEPSGRRLGVAVYGKDFSDPVKTDAFWRSLVEEHPEFAAGFSPSIDAHGIPGIEIILDKGGAKMADAMHHELVPALNRLAAKHGFKDVQVDDFKAGETSAEHDWNSDQTGSGYLSGLSARYGPEIQRRLELFKRQTLEPAIAEQIRKQKASQGLAPSLPGPIPRARGGRAMFAKAVRLAKQGGGPAALPLTGFPGEGARGATFQGPIRSHIAGRTDRHELDVPGGAYVIPSDVNSIAGEGNSEAGFEVFRLMMQHGPKGEHGAIKGASLPPLQLKGPVMKHAKMTGHGKHQQSQGGVDEDHGGPVPIVAAGGEIVIPPEMIIHKFGSLDHGHKLLDGLIKTIREEEIERLKHAPPPKK
jgi:hypothetical protein